MHEDEVHIVTGANRGLGHAIAEGLARDGATVVLACRDPEEGELAVARIRGAVGHHRVHTMLCDLSRPGTVDAFADWFLEHFPRLDVLVNNAGTMLLERQLSSAGVELGWHVGYLGHFQLTLRLLERLKASTPARVINLAGLYNRNGELRLDDLDWTKRAWDWGQAGSDTQLARVLFTAELAERLRGTGVTVNAVHPGAVRTHAQDVLPLHVRLLVDTVMRVAFVSPTRGARTVLRLVEDPELEAVTGRWFRRYHEAEAHPLMEDVRARQELWARSTELLCLPQE